jgi:hypothetical protein
MPKPCGATPPPDAPPASGNSRTSSLWGYERTDANHCTWEVTRSPGSGKRPEGPRRPSSRRDRLGETAGPEMITFVPQRVGVGDGVVLVGGAVAPGSAGFGRPVAGFGRPVEAAPDDLPADVGVRTARPGPTPAASLTR